MWTTLRIVNIVSGARLGMSTLFRDNFHQHIFHGFDRVCQTLEEVIEIAFIRALHFQFLIQNFYFVFLDINF